MAHTQARSDLARLQGEIKRLENQLLVAKEKAQKLTHYIEMSELYDAGKAPLSSSSQHRGGRSAAAADIAVSIITERGHPVHTRELLEELEKRGVTFDTTNPVTNLSSALSRSPLLVGNRSEGWSLTEWKESRRTEAEDDLPHGFARASTRVLDLDDDIPY